MLTRNEIKSIIEGLIMASSEPLKIQEILRILNSTNLVIPNINEEQNAGQFSIPNENNLDDESGILLQNPEVLPNQVNENPFKINDVENLLTELQCDYAGRGIELKEVATGYRFQVRADLGLWISKLFAEKPPRYSRALLETLALIAYKQPITRAEIEDVRGVAVSTNIMKTLQEHEWIRVIGYKEVPGKPALFATTDKFLDHFNLKSLAELPQLMEFTNEPHDESTS